jgi:arginyl-tRNA synthetase
VSTLADLRAAVEAASAAVRADRDSAPGAAPSLERPKQEGFGDYSTNAAMLLAPVVCDQPRAIAERLGGTLTERLGGSLARFEVAGPGFLNLFLTDDWYRAAVSEVLAAGEGYGAGGAARAERVNVEFVSANPTGPMHVGHARNAAYGDSLARLLALHGYQVTREFYINDYGSQVRKFGESIQARARGEEIPEDGYKGDYVRTLAAEIEGAADRPVEEIAREGIDRMVERMRATLEEFRVSFDVWFSERTLHEGDPDPVSHALEVLGEQGNTYRSEGALWLRTTTFGDDKDRVLVRSTGDHTYLASDVAYQLNKRERGFDRQILALGADHHGYVARMKAAYEAQGSDPDTLELLIMQFVHLVERGERSEMSKRAGDFVTLADLLDQIGVDAARWFLISRSHDTKIDLDLDLARSQSNENPVYYVQYAHARIASVLAKAGEERVARALAAEPGVELHPAERTLIKRLIAFPDEVADAAARRAPHRIAVYALELAQDFTAFYRDCRVVGAEPEELESFRIALSVATQRTIARSLDLLGVAAPDSM